MGKLNEIAQKAYECAVRRGKIDPDNDSNNNLHRDLLEEVAEVFECTGEKSPHIKEYLDVEEELADVIIVALSTLHHFKCDIDSLIEAKMNYNKIEWIDMGTGQLIKLIVEAFVLIFALPCVYKDFMNLWKEKEVI